MLLITVHDVAHPAFKLGGVLAALTLDHGDVNVVVTVADLRDGADEELERENSVSPNNSEHAE